MKHPTNNTIGAIWQWLLRELELHYPAHDARAMGNEIFLHFFEMGPAERVLHPGDRISESSIQKLQRALKALMQHVPLQYVTGRAHFMDLELEVNPLVLIPRPETEELVLWVVETLGATVSPASPPLTILDIGSGSGCIAIALAKRYPEASILAADLHKEILELVARNARKNGVMVETLHMDVLTEIETMPVLDVVVSNPPYVREQERAMMQPNVLEYEPGHALFVPDDDPLLFYREICLKALHWLRPGGLLFFEINEYLEKETLDLVLASGFNEASLRRDFHGKDRFIRAQKSK
jgi:release factor glutamine methyltransferase